MRTEAQTPCLPTSARRLDLYQVTLELIALCRPFGPRLKRFNRRLGAQLTEALASTLQNLAEAMRRTGSDRSERSERGRRSPSLPLPPLPWFDRLCLRTELGRRAVASALWSASRTELGRRALASALWSGSRSLRAAAVSRLEDPPEERWRWPR